MAVQTIKVITEKGLPPPFPVGFATTVSGLPSPAISGQIAYVTDGTAGLAWGSTVTGGQSTHYLVWYNGSAWTVIGK